VRQQLTLLQRYEDKKSIEEVETMHNHLKALLAEAQNDEGDMELRNSKFSRHFATFTDII
jgi:hypothetical protein